MNIPLDEIRSALDPVLDGATQDPAYGLLVVMPSEIAGALEGVVEKYTTTLGERELEM